MIILFRDMLFLLSFVYTSDKEIVELNDKLSEVHSQLSEINNKLSVITIFENINNLSDIDLSKKILYKINNKLLEIKNNLSDIELKDESNLSENINNLSELKLSENSSSIIFKDQSISDDNEIQNLYFIKIKNINYLVIGMDNDILDKDSYNIEILYCYKIIKSVKFEKVNDDSIKSKLIRIHNDKFGKFKYIELYKIDDINELEVLSKSRQHVSIKFYKNNNYIANSKNYLYWDDEESIFSFNKSKHNIYRK